MHRDLRVIMKGHLKASRGFLLNMPEARAQKITFLGLCLLQQSAGEKQAEGQEGLDWDEEERKEEFLREPEEEARLFAMQTTGQHLVGLVLPVLIL